MAEYDFLTFEDISAIHADQLARHGGAEGIVDRNVIESAIAAVQWAIRYDSDIATAQPPICIILPPAKVSEMATNERALSPLSSF
jgi:hypothetical protein